MIQSINPYVSDVTWTILAKKYGEEHVDEFIDSTVKLIKEIGLDCMKTQLAAGLLIAQDYEELISEEEVS